MKSKFETKCIAIANELDISAPLIVYDDERGRGNDVFEDDGYLHVRRRGVRAVFGANAGQDASASERNALFKQILEKLNYKLTPKLLERVIDDEPDEDDEYCPHCGAYRE